MANQGFLGRNRKGIGRIFLSKRGVFALLLIFSLLFLFISTPTTFRVLDAKTKQPIEGAVALVEWTSTGGLPGLSHTKTAKLAEDVSNSNGKLTIPGTWGRLALQTPHIKVYKPGYVGWDSRSIYLGYLGNDIRVDHSKKRTDFSMKNQNIFLEPWDEKKHSYISHGHFISVIIDFRDVGSTGSELKYFKAIHYEIPYKRHEWNIIDLQGK